MFMFAVWHVLTIYPIDANCRFDIESEVELVVNKMNFKS